MFAKEDPLQGSYGKNFVGKRILQGKISEPFPVKLLNETFDFR
ncbi:hypothetical protein LEP1GSC058_3974 [Leptospira fainei serovar Hurstbridge str. BUT 6]|uniref:Uncharacterized protein n=1 Tax=Leptospira fainei serovar Hurstbridge str. BUT 6 TaxID=1193011 RepID=S3UU17_9LEPT|nr:hypothetical protein LEP1GSC058_3974 [Leptospira fainei serovar Hurstbridge str. BUT 6]